MTLPELMVVLMGWAHTTSGLPLPAKIPDVQVVPASVMSHLACGDRPCKVMGWFPPGKTVYLNETLLPLENTYSSSIVVHELVHYLEQESGKWPTPYSCPDALQMEYIAYGAQRDFLTAYGEYIPVGLAMADAHCS